MFVHQHGAKNSNSRVNSLVKSRPPTGKCEKKSKIVTEFIQTVRCVCVSVCDLLSSSSFSKLVWRVELVFPWSNTASSSWP